MTAVHVSLNVAELARSLRFYRALLGTEPTKLMGDYAKFELASPPLVLSLIAQPDAGGNPINHLGFKLGQREELDGFEHRLTAAGYQPQREQEVECCYSRQTKIWAADPDGTHWELYVIEADAPTRGRVDPPAAASPSREDQPRVWKHRLGDALPEPIEASDATVDEVLLEGSFNQKLDGAAMNRLLSEARRVLKPAGTIRAHGLCCSRPLPAIGKLPGPAARVERVPVESEPAAALARAGFVNVFVEKLPEKPNFNAGNVELREFLVRAQTPASGDAMSVKTVVYRGPFAQSSIDNTVFERGRRAWLPAPQAEALRTGPAASHFVFLEAANPDPNCDPSTGCCD